MIRKNDGTGIANIRKNDGTGIAEVREYDGTLLYSSAPEFPENPTVIDDFESGSLDAAYSGDTGQFSVESTAYDGTYGAVSDPGSDGWYSVYTTDQTISQGQTISAWLRIDNYSNSNCRSVVWFGGSGSMSGGSADDGYGFRIQEGSIGMYHEGNGSFVNTNVSAITLSNWYRGVVKWETDGTFTYTVYDDSMTELDSVSGVDTNRTSGGYGLGSWDFGPDRVTRMDHITVWDH